MIMIAGILGGLGSGKTATLTRLAINYFMQGYSIYSNYHLYALNEKKPISKLVLSQQDLDNVHDGYFFGDELWQYVDSRMSPTHANKFVNDILLKSRKRGFNLIYTTQSFHQMDKRIRSVTDYIILPEIFIEINGRKFTQKQDFLKPISRKPLIPFTNIRVKVYPIDAYLAYFDYPITEFTFPLEPVTRCYDTNEEIEQLSKTEIDKGIRFETTFKMELENCFPDCEITLNPNSGQDQDSFDVEMQKDDSLIIFDCCTSVEKKYQGKTYNYLNLNHKNKERFEEIEKIRDAVTYFAYELNGNIMIVPAIDVWNIAKNKSTIPISKIEEISIELNDRMTFFV